jgi:AbiV family abortive infection protein
MRRKRELHRVPPETAARGFHLAVQNGQNLFSASKVLLDANSPIALGLAQLGQEEIGKSMLLLAVVGLDDVDEAWKWFWGEWRDHRIKAHRAYLYEIIYPQRIELRGEKKRVLDGGPLRANIAHEKEAAFYVDYDPKQQIFIAPTTAVAADEPWSRMLTLAYLGLTAGAVHDALLENPEEIQFRFSSFSEIAFRLCTEKIFQQDMPAIVAEFGARSDRHGLFTASLQRHLDSIKLRSPRQLPDKDENPEPSPPSRRNERSGSR